MDKTALNPNTESISTTLDIIIESIQDTKGQNIVKMDLRHLDEASCDYFVICEGSSVTQVNAIAGNLEKRIKDELGIYPTHTEGKNNATWVLVDYFDIIVHVFYPEARKFYELEELWSDAKITEYQDI